VGIDEQNRESRSAPDNGSDDRHLTIAMLFVGVAMMFVGFLDVFLSISGGFELAGVTPLLLYFAGVALWAQATIANLTVRYVIMGTAIVLALAIFHFVEVLFWHKQAVFWGTIVIVIVFMFRTAPPTRP
jgi:cation transport ATPase